MEYMRIRLEHVSAYVRSSVAKRKIHVTRIEFNFLYVISEPGFYQRFFRAKTCSRLNKGSYGWCLVLVAGLLLE